MENIGGKIKLALGVIGLIIFIYVMLWLIFFPTLTRNLPEDVLNKYAERLEAGDGEGAIGCTVHKFNESVSGTAFIEGRANMTVHNVEVVRKTDMDVNEMARIESIEALAELSYYVDVTDGCIIYFTATYYYADTIETLAESLPCLRIGSAWYLAGIPAVVVDD